ncbi:hypothetical protein GGP41_001652 [Bipolaris sorokiniana]|uniref:Uncharacterized protein n=1 Tax=Cochliobolus sativus TaxID=45130 RepID=A0A8H5ZLY9_COCSA|nr:hypothetical protein GGP41_001652 [Bipolaris sorokiniana]
MKRTPNPWRVHVSSSNFRQLIRHTTWYVRVRAGAALVKTSECSNGPRDKYPEIRVRLPDRLTANLRTSQA